MRGRTVSAVLALWLVAATVACGDAAPDATRREPRPVVVDTDGGSDDAMALLYLLQDPTVDVVAITVSGTGLVHCPVGARNVAGLVGLAKSERHVPIACGDSAPLDGTRAFPEQWRDQADGRYEGILPAGMVSADVGDAAELMASVIGSSPDPVTVLTLGPLTNLAQALAGAPDLAAHVERVVVMGGAFRVRGNVQLDDDPAASVAEWNIYVDPVAAQRVLDSGVPITFVPLDSQVPVDPYVVRDVARAATSPPSRVISDLLRSSPFFVSGQFAFWDPLAAAAVAEPELFSLRPEQVAVRTQGASAGWTTLGAGTPVDVATVRDQDAFIGAFVGTLDGRHAPLPHSRDADVTITAHDGCLASPLSVESGVSVLSLATPESAAAVGALEPGHSDAEIEAYLGTSPTGPPPWFALTAMLQTGSTPTAVLTDLPTGRLTVICVAMADGTARVLGRATVTAGAG